jgi:hypothetical protein
MANGEGRFESIDLGSGTHEGLRTDAGPSLVRPLFDLNHKLSDHEGQLKSFYGAISAVQSSLGSWVAVAIGLGAALLAVVTLIGAFEIYSSQKIDAKTDALSAKIDASTDSAAKRSDAIDRRVEGLATEVKQLPSAISRELIGVARDISEINRMTPKGR